MHIKVTSGFLLTEILIYIALGASIMLMAMNFFVRVFFELNKRTTEFNHVTSAYAVLDMIARVLEQAPYRKNDYKRLACNSLIWFDAEHTRDCALQIVDNTLVLIKGTFDAAGQKWLHKRKQVLLNNIAACAFDYTERETKAGTFITDFMCTLILFIDPLNNQKMYEIKKRVALKNGMHERS